MNKIIYTSVVLNVLVLSGCSSERQDPGEIAKEWSTNTRQLGIYPLFPPRERVYPGDIYIFPTAPTHAINKIPSEFYTIKPIRYSSQNITALLESEQKQSTLPETPVFTDATGERKPGPFISYPATGGRQNGLIAFPGYNFASVRDIRLGGGFANSAAAAKFGGASNSKYNVSFSVPYAETISIDFKSALNQFRNFRKSLWSDDLLALEFIGNQMQSRINDIQSQNNKEFNISPGIIFITDVYYARAIDVTVTATDGFGATGSATLQKLASLAKQKSDLIAELTKLTGNENSSDEPKHATADTAANTGISTGGSATAATSGGKKEESNGEGKEADLKNKVASIDAEMQALSASVMPGGLGLTGSVTNASGNSITMQQVFKYPVAIGYNGITLSLNYFRDNQDLYYTSKPIGGIPDKQPSTLPPRPPIISFQDHNIPLQHQVKPGSKLILDDKNDNPNLNVQTLK